MSPSLLNSESSDTHAYIVQTRCGCGMTSKLITELYVSLACNGHITESDAHYP